VRSPVDQLQATLGRVEGLAAGVAAEQWANRTPCPEWDVRALVQHVIAGNRLFVAALRGESAPPLEADDELVSALAESNGALVAAFGAPGVLDRPVQVPFGTVPGAVALHLRITEALVHGWDLARSTDQQPGFDDAIAAHELDLSRTALAALPADRRPFGPSQPAPDDAPAIDRLAALLGRPIG
jgi:uncharacterized protein (TIGR03086 family)